MLTCHCSIHAIRGYRYHLYSDVAFPLERDGMQALDGRPFELLTRPFGALTIVEIERRSPFTLNTSNRPTTLRLRRFRR